MAYLFLLASVFISENSNAQSFEDLSLLEKQAYEHTIKLQLRTARETLNQIGRPNRTPFFYYISNMANMAEIVISEDAGLYDAYNRKSEEYIRALDELDDTNPLKLLIQAEIKIHNAFVKLKFGEEFNGAWSIRSAYRLLSKNEERFPGFILNNKPFGLLHIMVGSIPENYRWISNLLNLKGSINQGMNELMISINQKNPFSFEASIIYHLIQSYVLFNKEESVPSVQKIHESNPDNLLTTYLLVSILIKSHQSEEALKVVNSFELKSGLYMEFPLLDYQRGDIYLQKANYFEARTSYKKFLSVYRGDNFVKDINYKLFLSYWLDNRDDEAKVYYLIAQKKGRTLVEADKFAGRAVETNEYPNKEIMKIRLLTDGGYYNEALEKVNKLSISNLKSSKDTVEFMYRKARLFHEMNIETKAIPLYLETISKSSKSSRWYFAPNSALMLGYIHKSAGQIELARGFFELAISYKNHEYENSIGSKAKTALEEINKL